MSEYEEIAVSDMQKGMSGEETGREMFAMAPAGTLDQIVSALHYAGFSPRDTLLGATEFSMARYPDQSEYEHRGFIMDQMKSVGYPADEVDAAAADIWRG